MDAKDRKKLEEMIREALRLGDPRTKNVLGDVDRHARAVADSLESWVRLRPTCVEYPDRPCLAGECGHAGSPGPCYPARTARCSCIPKG